MNEFEARLLKSAYVNYQKTGTTYFEMQARTGDELMYYLDAAEHLSESNHIIPMSDNIGADSINIIPHLENTVICYELTDLGLQYSKTNFKD